MPNVSVIIPTYNREKVIRRAVNSALNQSLIDIEVIVVDDGSTDGTKNVVDSISDSRLHLLEHQENKGGSVARNTGINFAEGEYIAFLDSDDEWVPQKLEIQLDELTSRSDEWKAIYSDFYHDRGNFIVNKIDNKIKRGTGLEGGEELLERLLVRELQLGGASTILIHSEAVEILQGFDGAFKRYQDIEFMVRYLINWKLAYIDESLVIKHDTGVPQIEYQKEAMELFKTKFSDLLIEKNLYQGLNRRDRYILGKSLIANGEFYIGLKKIQGSRPAHIRDILGFPLAVSRGCKALASTNIHDCEG